LLEGKNVNLRVVEKEDLHLIYDWNNDPEFWGEYSWISQESRTELEKRYENLASDSKWFFIEKEDGTKNRISGSFFGRKPHGNSLCSGSKRKG
jgi:RimJ/RimL family protein N-acetyltransferase